MIRVLIVDDHAIVRRGLRQIVGETKDIMVVAEAETGFQAIKIARQHLAEVMLLDISLPDKNGIEVLKQVKKEHEKLAVLMLTMHTESEFAIRSLRAGASGYLTKQSAPTQLITAIRHVAAGRKYVTPSLAEELANLLSAKHDQPPHASLSDREFQTMCLIASGKSLSDISAALHLSPKTISVYRARVLEKLNLRNNAEIARYAMRHGLVD